MVAAVWSWRPFAAAEDNLETAVEGEGAGAEVEPPGEAALDGDWVKEAREARKPASPMDRLEAAGDRPPMGSSSSSSEMRPCVELVVGGKIRNPPG